MSRRCQLFDYSGKRRLRSLSRKEAERMFDEGLVFRIGENFALMKPKLAEEGKRGIVRSLNLGILNPVRHRARRHKANEVRGRGKQLRGGRQSNYENALIAVAADGTDAETIAAFEAWKPKARVAPIQVSAETVSGGSILYFPYEGLTTEERRKLNL